jgi:hypothetical protein
VAIRLRPFKCYPLTGCRPVDNSRGLHFQGMRRFPQPLHALPQAPQFSGTAFAS